MTTTSLKPFVTLTAADLMSREVVAIPKHLSVRKAAHLLGEARVSGAPVIDARGVCVGVISATDFVHLADTENPTPRRPAGGCVCSEWQVIELENLPPDEVGCFMTPDPVTVRPDTRITD